MFGITRLRVVALTRQMDATPAAGWKQAADTATDTIQRFQKSSTTPKKVNILRLCRHPIRWLIVASNFIHELCNKRCIISHSVFIIEVIKGNGLCTIRAWCRAGRSGATKNRERRTESWLLLERVGVHRWDRGSVWRWRESAPTVYTAETSWDSLEWKPSVTSGNANEWVQIWLETEK